MTESLTALGSAIERRRMELHMSKADIQKSASISPNTYYRLIEGNIGQISLRTMNNIAKILGISLSALLSNDPSYGIRDDYAVSKAQLITALDKYLDQKLHELSAPVQVRLYERVFLGIMFEAFQSTQEEHIGILPIPDEVASKPGSKFAVQIFPGEDTPAPPRYAVLSYDKRMNIKLGLSDGHLHCITGKTKVDYFGYCYWDDQRGVVRIDRITHGATAIEIEYADITYICDVLMLIYV
jgi:transcriptional regulator with XRE-family HTH domain